MSQIAIIKRFRSRRLSTFVFAVFMAVLLVQQGARALPQSSDALKFYNNFFVTGGYVVGGVGLWNDGSGSIDMSNPAPPMTAAPNGAEVLAAFLYWQVVTSANPAVVDIHTDATFSGSPLGTPLDWDLPPTTVGLGGTDACPLNGTSGQKVYTFRADVQRFLDVDVQSGRRVINKQGGYHVRLPSNRTTRTLGASLVVIYRHPNPATPLNAIVLYDGTFVKQQPGTLRQRIEGFYDPASVPGQLTYIAGSAQSNLREVLRVDTDGDPVTPPVSTSDLFAGASGTAWDNVTRQTAALTGLAKSSGFLDTAIAPQTTGPLGFLINDCIAMGAMIYQTQVNDGDTDGLLDKWESSAVPLLDPNGAALPNFKAMGADPAIRDVFIEVAAMWTPGGTTYGSDSAPLRESLHSVTDQFGHNHMPRPAVLEMLGDEFAAQNIRLHFDVGNPATYHALVPPNLPVGDPNPYASLGADDFIVGAGGASGSDPTLARGGELIQETACEPTPSVVDCQFPDYPGTVSWKRGFQLHKEAVFDANRKDSFRFGLYAHSKASPKSLLPCLGVTGVAGFDDMGNCASGVPNPLIHVPSGVSGTADFPRGADFLVTLGLWDNTNFVGSDFGVASTTMHELGHTFGLGHGGDAMPNCKPNYLSVMNYMFQLGGLVDADGVPHLGYSVADYLQISETSLGETYSVPGTFRTSWYAPWSPGHAGTPVKKFCNGLTFPEGTPSMVRVDGGVGLPIDWNADGDSLDSGFSQDVNFDGEPDLTPGGPTTTLTGFNDWAALRLNQIGSRPNFAGFSAGPLGVKFLSDGTKLLADGSRILADGSWLLADGSTLLADGSVFLSDGAQLLGDGAELLADGSRILADGSRILADGVALLADGAVPLADGHKLLADGSVFLGDGAVFLSDGAVFLGDGVTLLADGAVFLGDGSPLLADGATFAWAWDANEPTPQSAAQTGNTPGPNTLTARVITDAGPNFHRIALGWKAPNTGDVALYRIYRAPGNAVTPQNGVQIAGSPVTGSITSIVDSDELPNGEFTYVVEAVLSDDEGTVTPRSNQRTVTAINVKPTANAQAVVVWEDWPSDPITLTGQDPDTAGLAFSMDMSGTLGTVSGAPPSVLYLSALNYNGPDHFSFRLHETTTWNGQNQASDPATVSITVTPVNDAPSFTKGPDQTVLEDAGVQQVAWATNVSAGPANESSQVLDFIVSNNNNALFSVQPALSATGRLTYTLAPNKNGSATVTVRLHDNGGTAEGHGAMDTSAPQVFTITVNPVNDAPSGTNKTVATTKSKTYTFKAADFGFSDPNDTPPTGGPQNTFQAVKITTLPASTIGTLKLANGTTVAVGAFVNPADLRFVPKKAGTVSFTFQVKDNGGTANSGIDVDQSANTMTVLVTDGDYD